MGELTSEGTPRLIATWSALLIALALGTVGCGSSESPSTAPAAAPAPTAKSLYAKTKLQSPRSGGATGTATFVKHNDRYTLQVDLRGLRPTHGQSQYFLWQIEAAKDRVSLETPDDMVNLASYRVNGNGRLAIELEPTAKAFVALENGSLTHFLVTKIESPARLQKAILLFDRTGNPPDLGEPIAEGTFRGSLVGAAGRQ
jgi:hypothetical protein